MEKFYELARAAKIWALFATLSYIVSVIVMVIGYEQSGDVVSIVLYSVFAILLFQYYQAVAKSAKEKDVEEFELACERQGRFIQVVGVFAMIAFVLMMFFIVIFLLFGLARLA